MNHELHLGVLYEHPEWFRPLFAELDRRGIRYDRLPAAELHFDPRARTSPYSLVVNRMSPSAYLRGHANGIFFAREFLRHLERTLDDSAARRLYLPQAFLGADAFVRLLLNVIGGMQVNAAVIARHVAEHALEPPDLDRGGCVGFQVANRTPVVNESANNSKVGCLGIFE